MKFLLDTNICIYIIKRKPAKVLDQFNKHKVGEVSVSTVTLYELCYGAYKSQSVDGNHKAIAKFVEPLGIIEFDEKAADVCGKIRADLERKGKVIGPQDLMIASQALSSKMTLVTNNLREFRRVSGLKLENWAR